MLAKRNRTKLVHFDDKKFQDCCLLLQYEILKISLSALCIFSFNSYKQNADV